MTISSVGEDQELLVSELSDLGATGFEQKDGYLLAYFDEDGFQIQNVTNCLKNRFFQLATLPEQNWNSLWESNFQPVVVNDFCGIRADFHEPIKDVEYEIIINPKMSFGTGHHATTYMMIDQMKGIDFKNKEVFDFGTGTGILAILAKRLGAFSVTALDVDEWSIENAKENFLNNGVESIELYQSSNVPNRKFDIILANINRNVLIEYANNLIHALKPNAVLLLSGLLSTDEDDILKAFNDLKHIRKKTKDNWISILFTN